MTHDETLTVAPRGAHSPGPAAHGHRRITVDWRYTQFVGLMRWLLPASALLLAATIIVWPHFNVAKHGTIVDVKALDLPAGDRPVMTNTRFLGTDGDGNPYIVTAVAVWQERDDEDIIHLEDLRGNMTLGNGISTTFRSDQGAYDRTGQLLMAESNVSVFTDNGYELHSDYARIDLGNGIAEGHLPVSGQGPAGVIDAQGFRITEGGDRLFLGGRVHLTLFPGTQP